MVLFSKISRSTCKRSPWHGLRAQRKVGPWQGSQDPWMRQELGLHWWPWSRVAAWCSAWRAHYTRDPCLLPHWCFLAVSPRFGHFHCLHTPNTLFQLLEQSSLNYSHSFRRHGSKGILMSHPMGLRDLQAKFRQWRSEGMKLLWLEPMPGFSRESPTLQLIRDCAEHILKKKKSPERFLSVLSLDLDDIASRLLDTIRGRFLVDVATIFRQLQTVFKQLRIERGAVLLRSLWTGACPDHP